MLGVRGVSTTGHSFVATDLIPAVPRPMLHSTVDQLREACTATGKLVPCIQPMRSKDTCPLLISLSGLGGVCSLQHPD